VNEAVFGALDTRPVTLTGAADTLNMSVAIQSW
jgi:hypothetical protein